ncbi:unnamed protein product [Pleuronectes platessa]|uniref:Uncharacterized protein n=1 Tax=Pleuronectes platessa TaxID=8262 RepID=A0A9N7VDU0_PLEPL|nr:unnamed protein product [Pleuronectes platessa]
MSERQRPFPTLAFVVVLRAKAACWSDVVQGLDSDQFRDGAGRRLLGVVIRPELNGTSDFVVADRSRTSVTLIKVKRKQTGLTGRGAVGDGIGPVAEAYIFPRLCPPALQNYPPPSPPQHPTPAQNFMFLPSDPPSPPALHPSTPPCLATPQRTAAAPVRLQERRGQKPGSYADSQGVCPSSSQTTRQTDRQTDRQTVR